jgi:hypothetical protein
MFSFCPCFVYALENAEWLFPNSDQTTTTGHGPIAYNLIHCNGLRVGVSLHVPLVHAEHVGANQPAESESESESFFSRVDTEMFKQLWAAVGDREVAKSTITARQVKSSQVKSNSLSLETVETMDGPTKVAGKSIQIKLAVTSV